MSEAEDPNGLIPGPDPAWHIGLPLRLEGVRLSRGPIEILRGVDVTFEPGRRYVLVGPSGAGKSTLLRLLNRLEDPESGTILLGATPLHRLPVRLLRGSIAMVFQSPRPLPGTIAENLSYPFAVRGRRPPAREALGGLLGRVGLDAANLDRSAAGLSGGERQRLILAMALACGPEILLLDEPTAALDPGSAGRLFDLLDELTEARGLRIIAVTHQAEHAARLGDTLVEMAAGRVVRAMPIGSPTPAGFHGAERDA